MLTQWYYGQVGHKLGPYSAVQLRELAVAGKILDTDTVWKHGIDRGVLATKVKNLFPPPALLQPAAGIEAALNQPVVENSMANIAPVLDPAPGSSLEQPGELAPAPSYQPPVAKKPARKSRAMAIRGARITSQDGANVQFTKICIKCGYEDPSRTTMPIRTGMTRMTFYCRKCRKAREVEIQGLN